MSPLSWLRSAYNIFRQYLELRVLNPMKVDINPYRQSKFSPCVAQEIRSPEVLKEYKPDEIILMNSIYTNEIQKMLDEMGGETTIVAI